jgi:hypothetical protein
MLTFALPYKRATTIYNNQIKDEVTLHFVYLTYYAKNKSCTEFNVCWLFLFNILFLVNNTCITKLFDL